ncbi:Acyl-CoA dehydrogenase family member 10 [Apodemus speciosus]|uniref:Acyl-CoA dehydrogenase family member 10 n=1 Tax=Apodemus speciosus TaxID=105296 RepID=A0ABQ0ETM6_APOSI
MGLGWEVQNHVPSGTILKALIRGSDGGPWTRFLKGEMKPQHFLEEFGRLCSEIAETPVPVSSFLALLTSEHVAKQFPVMTQAISQIRAEGLQTAVLTNNFYLSNGKSFLPLDRKQFDVVVESCVEGICKPDPRIYQLCLQRLSLQPSEAIFLDDLGPNLKAASSLGIRTIKVDSPETAVKELEALLGFPLHVGVPNTRAVRKTMEIPQDALEKYLKGLLGTQHTGPLQLLQFDHGQSNPTYYIRLADRQLVLRKKPPGTLLPSAHAIEREFRIMKALGNAGVPVPTVLDLCEDSSIVGTPFYLMEYCPGTIYKDPSLPGLEPSRRRAIYTAMNQVLCRIHSVDLQATGLDSFGKQGDYIPRQVQTWTKQYRAAETGSIPAMERLIQWLPLHLPRQQRTTVVHGDFRLDNLIFHPEKAEVLAVLDWELSTLGDPFADVAYSCLAHYLPSSFPMLRGFRDQDVAKLGIPTAEEYFRTYCRHVGLPPIDNWNFYMAFSFFRVAAILQGVYKRSLTGQWLSSGTKWKSSAESMFQAGLGFCHQKRKRLPGFQRDASHQNTDEILPRTGWATVPEDARGGVSHSTVAAASPSLEAEGGLIISPEACHSGQKAVRPAAAVCRTEGVPRGARAAETPGLGRQVEPSPLIEDLKRAVEPFPPLETDPEKKYGAGLTNVEYAHLCEVMGTSLYASELYLIALPGCRTWRSWHGHRGRGPLAGATVGGQDRSCFAMTEPQVASSDASNIEASIQEERLTPMS